MSDPEQITSVEGGDGHVEQQQVNPRQTAGVLEVSEVQVEEIHFEQREVLGDRGSIAQHAAQIPTFEESTGETHNVFNIHGNVKISGAAKSGSTSKASEKVSGVMGNIISSAIDIMKREGRFVSIDASEPAIKTLSEYGIVIIVGSHGTGKTALGRNLLLTLTEKEQRSPVILTDPNEWNLLRRPINWGKISTSEKYVILIDDMFGKNKLNEDLVNRWQSKYALMEQMIDSGQVALIMCLRIDIYKASEHVNQSDFFQRKCLVNLNSYDLLSSQKEEIFRSITQNRHRFSKKDIERLTNISKSQGFPGCCRYFAKCKAAQKRGVSFFENPIEWVRTEIDIMKDTRRFEFFVLLLVMFQGGKLKASLWDCDSDHVLDSKSVKDLREISRLHKVTKGDIEHTARSLDGNFLSYDKMSRSFYFSDQSVYDTVARSFLDMCPQKGFEICPLHVVVEYTSLEHHAEDQLLVVPELQNALAQRLSHELGGGNFEYILNHDAFKNFGFLDFMKREGFLNNHHIEELLQSELPPREVTFEEAFGGTTDLMKYPEVFPRMTYIFKYKSKMAVIVMKGLTLLSHLLLERVSERRSRYQEHSRYHDLALEILPCFCYMGNLLAVKKLKDIGVQPTGDCLFASACSKTENTDILKYVVQKALPENPVQKLGHMLRMTLQLGRGESSVFLVTKLKKYPGNVTLYDNLLAQLLLQCHGKYGQRFKKSQHGIEICSWNLNEEYQGTRVDWETLLPVKKLIKKLLCSNTNHTTEGLILLAAGSKVPGDVESLFERDPESVTKARSESSETVLHIACRYGSAQMVRYILTKNIDATCLDENEYLAVHRACLSEFETVEKINILLDTEFDINAKTKSGQTILHLVSSNGDNGTLQHILTHTNDVNAKDNEGETPVHAAAARVLELPFYCSLTSKSFGSDSAHAKCVSLLIREGADVTVKNIHGDTALHHASESNSESVMQLLIRHGANVNEKGALGETALFRSPLSVSFLLDHGADHTLRNDDGNTVLHTLHKDNGLQYFGFEDDIQKITIFLHNKSADMNAKNNMGETCLHLAAANIFIDEFDHFATCQIDENIPDVNGETVHFQLPNMSLSKLSSFSEHCLRNPVSNVRNKDGEGAIHICVKKGAHMSLSCLLEKSADINLKNSRGQTALHIAVENGYWNCVTNLLNNHAKVNVADLDDANTPLHIAASKPGMADKVELLLQNGAHINTVNSSSLTPLHLAVRRNLTDVVKILVAHHCCQHIKDNQGNIPLHVACLGINFDMISDLAADPTSLSIKDAKGNTPIHLVVSKPIKQLFGYLKTNGADESDIPLPLKMKLSPWRRRRLEDAYGSEAPWMSLYWPLDKNPTRQKKTNNVKMAKRRTHTVLNPMTQKKINELSQMLSVLLSGDCVPLDSFGLLSSDEEESDSDSDSDEESLNSVTQNKACQPVFIDPLAIIESMIQRSPNINIQNSEGNTPLHLAALSGSWKVVHFLLEKGAEQNGNLRDDTPLHLAIHKDHIMTVKLLLKSGADPRKKNVDGNTPVHLAAMCGHTNMMAMLLGKASASCVKHLKTLFRSDIGKGVFSQNVNLSDVDDNFHMEERNVEGETALHVAARHGWVKIVKGLLVIGACHLSKNTAGKTAKDIVIEKLKSEILNSKPFEKTLRILNQFYR